MFPLIAIAAFFILGIAFFVIGKDDFGIKRIKEGSKDTSEKEKLVPDEKSTPNEGSSEKKKELITVESSTEIDSDNNISE